MEKVTPVASQFAARFRAANAYIESSFDQRIDSDTARAYSAIVRFSLVYASWELFLGVFGLSGDAKQKEIERIYPSRAIRDMLDEDLAGDAKLFRFLEEHSDERSTKRRIKAIRETRAFTIAIVCELVRNTVLHGHMTANPWRWGKENVTTLLSRLSDHMMRVMNEEAGPRAHRILDVKDARRKG